MTLQDQIEALLAEAAPLRLMADDTPEAAKLGRLVDKINALRAQQSCEAPVVVNAAVEGAESVDEPTEPTEPVKRSPGRPKKA
jgi:hypothetical protein